FTLDGTVYTNPYRRIDNRYYISYYKKDFITNRETISLSCTVLGLESEIAQQLKEQVENGPDVFTGEELRTYRLACAASGEYTVFHGGTVELGLAAIVTAVNRVTGVYEREVAVRLVLIANNDLIVYTNPATDPYTNSNGFTMLTENQTNLDAVIGSANYDVGHVFSTGSGGVAFLTVICQNGFKAKGVTGLLNPIGDPFYIDYIAHEMGHQFGGNHSFNGNAGSCGGGNRNASTAYEPGSGSTIMAYAGICGSQNLQSNSDDYFHNINFVEIVNHTTGSGNSCAQITATGNTPPTVNSGTGGFTIPINTPFILTGSATDPDGDTLTYNWEEFDLGPAGHPNSPSGNAPIFRTFDATLEPWRTFPKLSDLLNNTQTIGEILPSYTRSLKFRLTVRDNRAGGGGVDYDEIQFDVTNAAGPFLVTTPNTSVTWQGNSVQTVTWDVANTSAAPVNTTDVNILLSVDGGITYLITLASNTPNDGGEQVLIPNDPTTQARIKVEAAGNIFFDISNEDFTIEDDPIPVEITTFFALVTNEGVILKWVTSTETNNQGFEIQRSITENKYEKIGYIPGHGTTTEIQTYSYTDSKVASGNYTYRLKQIDYDGTIDYSDEIAVKVTAPLEFALEQNFPNPFNPSTQITYTLAKDSEVTLSIYDMLGTKVAELVNAKQTAGSYMINFNAKILSSGVYIYRIDTGNFTASKKLILMK
ncbi:MAG: T9SS type A sorting domain-containing protein, partial [Bacteroidetes bacterium]|nr:T9SS type A sorting domain-containing protein [Bacteroidota bacterium]